MSSLLAPSTTVVVDVKRKAKTKQSMIQYFYVVYGHTCSAQFHTTAATPFFCLVQVNMWSLGQAGTTGQQIGVHDAAVKTVRFIPEMNLVASASWQDMAPRFRSAYDV